MVAVRILADFAWRQTQSCAFAFGLVLAIVATRVWTVPGIARYDLLLLICLGLQALMLWAKWETWRDVAVIAVFHLVGVLLEWHKVQAGSWSYPEPALTKINGVPLYSGFMYAAVASYMSLAWRKLEIRFVGWPSRWVVAGILALVYGQFFFGVQELWVRFVSLAVVLAAFAGTFVAFSSGGRRLSMPAPVSLLLIGFHIYLAENIATYFGAWTYPNQANGWEPVHLSKVISWTLLMVVSLAIVYEAKERLGRREALSTA